MAASSKRPAARRQRGAALLILVALVGLGAAALLISALGHSTLEARRVQRTVAKLGEANEALLGFAVRHGRLPRPAVSALDGGENPLPCDSEQSCTGLLPWVALGIDGVDAWGKRLRYSVTPVFTNSPLLRISAVATKTVQQRDAGGALSYIVGQSTCDLGAQCAPLVVLSHGRENFGSSVLGIALPNAAVGNVDEQLNAASARHFVDRVASAEPAAPGGPFDDIVGTLPLSTLYQQMGAAHVLP